MTKLDFSKDLTKPIVTRIPACSEPMPFNFVLTRVGRSKILLTGGYYKNTKDASAQAFLLDIRLGKWVAYPGVPNLN